MKNQNNEQKKTIIREYVAKVSFIFANIIVYIIIISDSVDYANSSRYPVSDTVFIRSVAIIFLIVGTTIFFTAYFLPKKWIYEILSIFEIILLVLIIIFIIFSDGYYSLEAHIRRIFSGFLVGYGVIYLEYHFFRYFLNEIFSKQSPKKNTGVSMYISEIEDSNLRQSWKDRFLQKIFHGISTFSFIPLVATIIAPMITYLLPIAYSIYYLLQIPSTDVMLGVIDLHGYSLLVLIIDFFLIELYFIISSLLLLSIVTMAKEKKKGNFGLIQHGIYARIRHPQNLAISLILFLVFILWATVTHRLQTGKIISWGFFTLFLQLEALIEEKKLLKQFPDQYWAYIHNTGFFHPRLRKNNPVPPKLPYSELKYFSRRIILSITAFILFYLSIFFVVIVLKNNNSELLEFYDPFHQYSNVYPKFHFVNEIVVVLVPIGIWLVSFIITLVQYLKEKSTKKVSASSETEKEQSLILNISKAILFWVLLLILIIFGLLFIGIVMDDLSYLSR